MSELRNTVEYLKSAKLIKKVNQKIDDDDCYQMELTYEGWNEYNRLKEINLESRKAFVAMNFDKEYDQVFNYALVSACDKCGFVPFRIDKEEHNEKICDKIIAGIRESRFLIAEFTGQKHGVYFEAGYAYGLGLPVIWICSKDDLENIHFDTRQYNHIIWESVEELKEKLIDRIKATIKSKKVSNN